MTGGTTSLLSYDVFALSDLADDRYSELQEAVTGRLSVFECKRSTHLEEFARGKVHNWESHGHSRTYILIVPDDEFGIEVAGFFTIGMATLDLTKASASKRKSLSGNIPVEQTGAFCIAELARHDRFTGAQLPGTVLLDEAKEIVRRARALVGGRFLVVDAQEKVFGSIYEPAGFKRIKVASPPVGMEGDFVTACCVIKDW